LKLAIESSQGAINDVVKNGMPDLKNVTLSAANNATNGTNVTNATLAVKSAVKE
jgi:hypothetical protein